MSQWYCFVGDREYGPWSIEQLQQMAYTGQLQRETPLRQGHDTQWFTAGSYLPALFAPAPADRPGSAGPGMPVGTSYPAGTAVAAEPATKRRSAIDEDLEAEERRRRNAMRLTIGVAGTIGAIVIIAIVIANFRSDPNADSPTKTPSSLRDPESNPEASGAGRAVRTDPEASPPPPRTVTAASATPPASAASNAQALQIVRSMKWRDAAKTRAAGLKGIVSLRVAEVWRADSADGAVAGETRPALAPGESPATAPASASPPRKSAAAQLAEELGIEPTTPKPASQNPATTAEAPGEVSPAARARRSDEKGRYLFVTVEVKNASTGPLAYTSWNLGAGSDLEPLLVGAADQLLKLVPIADAPVSGRQQQTSLQPDQTLTDTVVFDTQGGDATSWRLVLPYRAIGKDGALGFEIPTSMYAAAPPPANAAPAVPSP